MLHSQLPPEIFFSAIMPAWGGADARNVAISGTFVAM
jgi:hypothetical protein